MNYITIIKSQTKVIAFSVILLTISILGISYATVFRVDETQSNQVVEAGTLSVNYSSSSSALSGNFVPMDDSTGQGTSPYEFTVNNNGNINASYSIIIFNKSVSGVTFVPHNLIRVSVDGGTPETLSSLSTYNTTATESDREYILYTNFLNKNKSRTHRIRVWLDENADSTVTGQTISLQIKVVSNVKEKINEIATTYVSSIAATDDSIIDDGTTDHNLRYIGADPDNYVWFNNELWRIVGVMNNVEGSSTDTGTGETRIKIAKATAINYNMYWTEKATSPYNYNNWEYSTLKKYFNGSYYNNLSDNNLLDTATFYLGGYDYTENSPYNLYYMTASGWYVSERNTSNVNGTNPGTWTGNIALMYPSDYGFATETSACQNTSLFEWKSENYGCATSDWLYDTSGQWILTPSPLNTYHALTISPNPSGYVGDNTVNSYELHVKPVAYLKTTVKIVDGEGTSDNPYQLSIN